MLGNIPVFDNFDRNCLAKAITYPWLKCDYVADTKKVDSINKMLREFTERNSQMFFVSINEWLCREKCSPYVDGKVMYFDKSHLNVIQTQSYSSTSMADELKKALQY